MIAVKINFVIIARVVMQNFRCDFRLGATTKNELIYPHAGSIRAMDRIVMSRSTKLDAYTCNCAFDL